MYSPIVINKVIEDFERRNGWLPVRHTVEQVEEFKDYIESIVDIQQNERSRWINFKQGLRLTEKRRAEIQRWIVNEQFMCFADSNYFETRYAFICNEANDIFKFKNRKSQEIFDRILEPFDEQQVAIELFVLKARQLGVSTKVALKFLHRLLFIPHTQGVMASVKDQNTLLLARILDTCWTRLPFWLGPGKTSLKADAPKWANGSIMSIQSGSQAMGIAQGWTPSLIHISEVADIPRPQKVLEEGLFRAAHSTSKLFFVMEGTGSEANSWQALKWKYYKENWGKGGRFMPLFIPWPCATDLYPQKDWLRKNPIPEMWNPIDETKRMARKAELYIRSNDALSRIMGVNYTMPREQQWFWEANYREALASRTHKVWLAQMPVTDDEALQSKNDLVFSQEVIEVVSERAQKDYQAYAITGNSVLIGQDDKPYEPDPESIDYSKERIVVDWMGKNGQLSQWTLIPLLPFNDTDDNAAFNKLLVFRPPEKGQNYSMGVDTADGLGNPEEDRSVASVLLNRTGNARDEQCAEFVSNNLNPAQMVSIAACLGAWYSQRDGGETAGTKDPRGVKFCIEQRERPGDDCQHQLKLMGFTYHHKFVYYDSINVDPNRSSKHGWYTNVWSRPMLLNRFIDAVVNGWVKINSPMAIRQMKDWVRTISASGKSKLDHESGKHDDNIMGIAMAYFTAHSFDVLVERQQTRYAAAEEIPELDLSWCENTITV